MADIQELFAKLQNSISPGLSSNEQNQTLLQSTSPSLSKSPSYHQPQSQNVSMPTSQNGTNMKTGNSDSYSADRTANLLNLLRFNQPSQAASTPEAVRQATQSHEQDTDIARSVTDSMSASVLVDELTRNASTNQPALVSYPPASKLQSREDISSDNPQDFLLKLLNTTSTPSEDRLPIHAKIATQGIVENNSRSPVAGAPEKETTPIRVFGSNEEGRDTPFEPPQVMSAGSMFTYVNPFEQLSASSPRRRSPKPTVDGDKAKSNIPKVEILRNKQDDKDIHMSSDVNKATTSNISESAARLMPGSEEGFNKNTNKHNTLQLDDFDIKAKQRTSAFVSITSSDPSAKEETIQRQTENDAKSTPYSTSNVENATGNIQEAAGEALQSSGEDQTYIRDEEVAAVRVYNFPMRPFVSIEIKSLSEPVKPLRDGAALEIARLKKDFDQVDRNLVTASTNLIAYASPKSGGFRVISQDSGRFKQGFQSVGERVFNLSICKAISDTGPRNESIIATSVNGSVLWSRIAAVSEADFESEKLEEKGVIFPPIPSHDDHSSCSQLKTRAKKSSRHPEFFGIGRGKAIYIVRPEIASQYLKSSKSRVVNIDRYFKERSMKIGTGKAGKDFAFSEDDTVIATLDKAGKLKFWDIRELAQFASENNMSKPLEISNPLLTLSTFSPSDKSWPTSVIFLDKEKPTVKGVALRYLVVGMKQNHILQLWDIALGKAVQEIHFPHKTESDAICSVAYHARTGILVVGHPTRNSIYLIQVSAPKYNLPPMSQYAYIQRLARGLPGLPKPESTAIMSGIRELSMAPSNQLRSLDILSNPYPTGEDLDNDDMTLFEIYTMHSRGVTCYRIKKRDLGWSKDGRTVDAVDAVAERAISVKSLHLESNSVSSEPSLNGDEVSQSPIIKGLKQTFVKEALALKQNIEGSEGTSMATKAEQKHETASSAVKAGTTKVDKKKKKKLELDSEMPADLGSVSRTNQATPGPASATIVADAKYQDQNADLQVPSDDPEYVTVDTKVEQSVPNSSVLGVEKLISDALDQKLSHQLNNLYRRFEEDKRVQEAAGAARQDAILRLVSSTLTDNVEKSLSRIVINSIQGSVLPALSELTKASLSPKIFEDMAGSLQSRIQKDIKTALPNAISRAMQEPEIIKAISELVSKRVATQIDSQISNALNTTISPRFTNLALTHIEKAIKDVEKRTGEQLGQAERNQIRENSKIDRLLENNQKITENIHSLATSQIRLQEQVERMEQQLSTQHGRVGADPSATSQVLSPADEEVAAIDDLFKKGNVIDGTIRWIQSHRQTELFDRYFCNQNPAYLKQLSQLLALSISAAVTVSMNTNILKRLNWLETVLANLSPRDPEIIEVIPRIMDVLLNRLQRAYMEVAESDNAASETLKRISVLVRRANELKVIAASE